MEQTEPGKLTNTYFLFCFYAVLVIFGVCSAVNYLVFTRTVERWKKSKIPFLPPMFLLGHKYFLNWGQYSGTEVVDRIYRENKGKELIAFFMLMTPVILVKDTKLIKHIFGKNFNKTYQNGFTVLKDDIEAQSLIGLTSDKMQWKAGRTLMAPAFSTSKLYGALEFAKIKKQMEKLIRYAENMEIQGKPIDVKEAVQNFTIDSISLWGFGVDIDSYQNKGELYEIARSAFAPSYTRMLKFLIMMHFPALQVFRAFQFFDHKYKVFLKNLLTDRMTHRSESANELNDFINYFLSFKQKDFIGAIEENFEDLIQKNEAVCMRRLVGYSMTILLGGTHTSAMAAAYTLHSLSLHPEYQKRIKEEIEEAMLKHQASEFTAQVVQDLHFTQQCVLEAERLYPSLAFLVRRCTDDIQIPGTSLTLKKGDRVIISPYSMHRDPCYFKEPNRFDPYRFSPQNKDSISPETFLAFGYGPKKCPAYKQGNFLAVTLVATLLHKYEVRPHSHFKQMDAMDLDPKSFTNHHKRDLFVNLIRRQTETN